MLNDAQRQGNSCRGLGRDSDRYGELMCVIYWWDVGLGHSLVVMFDPRIRIRLTGDQKVVG